LGTPIDDPVVDDRDLLADMNPTAGGTQHRAERLARKREYAFDELRDVVHRPKDHEDQYPGKGPPTHNDCEVHYPRSTKDPARPGLGGGSGGSPIGGSGSDDEGIAAPSSNPFIHHHVRSVDEVAGDNAPRQQAYVRHIHRVDQSKESTFTAAAKHAAEVQLKGRVRNEGITRGEYGRDEALVEAGKNPVPQSEEFRFDADLRGEYLERNTMRRKMHNACRGLSSGTVAAFRRASTVGPEPQTPKSTARSQQGRSPPRTPFDDPHHVLYGFNTVSSLKAAPIKNGLHSSFGLGLSPNPKCYGGFYKAETVVTTDTPADTPAAGAGPGTVVSVVEQHNQSRSAGSSHRLSYGDKGSPADFSPEARESVTRAKPPKLPGSGEMKREHDQRALSDVKGVLKENQCSVLNVTKDRNFVSGKITRETDQKEGQQVLRGSHSSSTIFGENYDIVKEDWGRGRAASQAARARDFGSSTKPFFAECRGGIFSDMYVTTNKRFQEGEAGVRAASVSATADTTGGKSLAKRTSLVQLKRQKTMEEEQRFGGGRFKTTAMMHCRIDHKIF